MKIQFLFALILLVARAALPVHAETLPFRDPGLPVDKRVEDLVSRLTVEEKISQLMMASAAIPRLNIPAYHWWNEALHGSARNGVATVFPQAIALAATWDPPLHQRIADAISTEIRAKNNETVRKSGGATERYQGLTIWSPNINIFRDPRWGRGQETYGEDPFLTGRMAVAFVHGLQGDDPHYLKTVATVKHFAVHSGPEELRHVFNAVVSDRDLRETYLPQFQTAITEGGAWSLMSAYNAIDGIPAPANKLLLTDVLRGEWQFRGAVVGDVDTISDMWRSHHYATDAADASARALKAGDDLCSGTTYQALPEALRRGLVTEADIDRALCRLLLLRFKLGQFDPPDRVPYTRIPMSEVDSPPHDALALVAARESLVLLKNDGALPWDAASLKTVAVLGPTAGDMSALVGNYNGSPSHPITILQGLRNKLEPLGVKVLADPAVPLVTGFGKTGAQSPEGASALDLAQAADHVVLVLGITPSLEGEEMRVTAAGFSHGDRTSVLLPKVQRDLIDRVAALGKPFVVVLTNGSPLSFDTSKPNAILEAWYYGQRGGDAVAEALLGDTDPGGRLPLTFYRSDSDLPPFTDYSMQNRTYRYFTGQPLFAFGYGLSYTTFAYKDVSLSAEKAAETQSISVNATVTNTGAKAGDEVVQVYAHAIKPPAPMPIQWLIGFQRVSLAPQESKTVAIQVKIESLRRWDSAARRYRVDPGAYEIRVGSASDRIRQARNIEVVP